MVERWTLPMHSIGILTGCGVAVVVRGTWPLEWGAGLSFLAWIGGWSGRWTSRGGFGAANAITALRLALLIGLLAVARHLSSLAMLAGLSLAFALDALDGLVARRRGCASDFGAAFDMEVDAAFVLFVGYLIWLRQGVAAWVLVPGLLRYLYVLCLVLWPPTGIDRKRSQFGRVAFGVTAVSLLAALALGPTWARLAAGLGTMVSCLSFGLSFSQAYPALPAEWRALARKARSLVILAIPTLGFLLCWTFLDLWVNVRYPAPEPAGWYFLPSLDVSVILVGFALWGFSRRPVPWVFRVVIALGLLLVRIVRVGDGIQGRYFGRMFTIYIDLPQVADLVRYAHSTMARWKFALAAVGVVLGLVLLIFTVDRALAFSARYLGRHPNRIAFAAVLLPFALVSIFLRHDSRYNDRYAGAFAGSATPRLEREVKFLFNVYSHRAREASAIASVEEVLRHTPDDLERLHHANVYLCIIESYGATVMDRALFVNQALPALRAIEGDLARHGFASASGLLTSATYGGMSWLAHATLLTGVRTTDQLAYDVLGISHPRSMARIFHDAGYQTVLVAPNTTRVSEGTKFYDFDTTFARWNFDYAGPAFAWATMPDQYVLDYVRRRAIEPSHSPLFVTYVLVSSHAPWSLVPTLVPNWWAVGNGAIYNSYPLHHADINWPDFQNASEQYIRSILYDLQTLDSYLVSFVHDGSLMIVLGDHQPVSELTLGSSAWEVPVHIVSRNPELVAPFRARGYAPGMVPGTASAGMESFLVNLLEDFSRGHRDARP